jgi:hypothetical protein
VVEPRPLCRRDLLTEEIDGELLVYDEQDHVALRLNRTAALVWRASDGTRTIPELVAALSDQLGEIADEDLVTVALDRLQDNRLIESGYDLRDPKLEQLSRRRFVRRAGAVGAAALALPIVQAVVAPTAAAAQSPPSTTVF